MLIQLQDMIASLDEMHNNANNYIFPIYPLRTKPPHPIPPACPEVDQLADRINTAVSLLQFNFL